MEETSLAIPAEYGPFLEELKERIRSSRVEAAAAVTRELILLYWSIGQRILIAQQSRGWGAKVIPKLSADLARAFPDMKGLSPRNLDYMLAFAKAWPEEAISQQSLRNLPWGHHLHLSAVDDLLRTEGDTPSIGLILCQHKNRVMAEYALRGMTQPMGVSSYDLTTSIPESIRAALPTIEEIEEELSEHSNED